jgi:HD-GYP domain-containing protein (c-di-GMP phosphodiesterase class II)
VLSSLAEIRPLLSGPAFAEFPLLAEGDGFVELGRAEGVLILAEARLADAPDELDRLLRRAAPGGPNLILILGRESEFSAFEPLRQRAQFGLVGLPVSHARLAVNVRNFSELMSLRAQSLERGRSIERYQYEIGELIAISRAISSERDIGKLLGLILEKSRYVTNADAGSVYIVEGMELDPSERTLRFVNSQNDSIQIDFREFSLPVDEKSIVGRAVISREIINIPDLYQLDQTGRNPWGFRHDKQFDRKTGYQGRSMLTVPMINQKDEVIGVIQLINRRREGAPPLTSAKDFDQYVIPFDTRSEELSRTLASQAGISLENTLLYEDIRRLFDGFVNASVTAIESRDPTTSGHSYRVAKLTVGLAEEVDREHQGPYAGVSFTTQNLKEIEYAGLLHDFGKVGVREQVLVKAKKLYEPDRALLLSRFDFIRKTLETESLKQKLELISKEGLPEAERRFGELDIAERASLRELDEFLAFILKANEPTVLAEGSFERLTEIARLTYRDPSGQERPYLTAQEVEALRLPRGSLTSEERLEIESHVVHTFKFLENIPWGRLAAIPLIAGSHHEKLDGSGYPRGLKAGEIRVESKMMAIADIFDALTASDRPYKKAVPVEKALDIIGFEVKEGKCDKDLFQIFIGAKVWQRVLQP